MMLFRPFAWLVGLPFLVALTVLAILTSVVVWVIVVVSEDFERIARWVFDE